MRLTAFAVRNPRFTLVAFVCLAVLGVTSFRSIPRAEDPYFPTPIFAVVAVYPGATPAEVERDVVIDLEDEIAELADIERIRTTVRDGVAVVMVEFDVGVDTQVKDTELRRQVEAARPSLPAGLRSLEVTQGSTTNVDILQLAVVAGPHGWDEVERHADALARAIEAVPGVKEVEVVGIPDDELRVALDVGAAARRGVALGTVLDALAGNDISIPGGTADVGTRQVSVATSGAYTSAAGVAATVVGGGPGAIVQVGDLADVTLGRAAADVRTSLDGQPCALVTVTLRNGQNIFTVRDAVLGAVRQARTTLPPGMTLDVGFDQSRNVDHRLSGLERDFIIAIVLVLLTLVPLGLRASLVVMVSIPMSLALGVAALAALGFSLNQLSIVGFVIALGLLVDDSIVVAENITRWMRAGKDRTEAAILASRQIGVAVLGCTATLVLAFVPLLFLPGTAGMFIRSLPVAVVVTILASLLVSLTLIPFLASRWLRAEDEHGNPAFRVVSRGIETAYRPVLNRAMRHPVSTLVVAGAFVAACVALVPSIGFSLFPKAGIPQVMVHVTTPDGTSVAHTAAIAREVEAAIHAEPEVRAVLTTVGRGHPQVYYNVQPRSAAANVADLFVQLRRYDADVTPVALDHLRARLATIPGAEITVREFENGPPVEAPIAVRVIGDDLGQLRTIAAEVARTLAATPGTRDVRNPLALSRTDVKVDVDDARAGMLGLSPVDVDRAVRLAIAGLEVGKVRLADGDEARLLVTLPDRGGGALDRLDLLELPGRGGGSVPFRQVADLALTSAPPLVQRTDRERTVTITADVRSGASVDAVSTRALAAVGRLPLPPGYRWEAGGLVESRKKSFGGLGPAVIIAVFGILAILVLEFRSFSATLIVASVIPLGAAGGLLALWLYGETLSFTAAIGFIALTGIEVKNSLLLVDFINQLRGEGRALDDAIREAGEVRFFPILLTSLTAIGGLIPLVLERSALYSPLAIVLIGGLVSSTLLSRLVTPVLAKLLLGRSPVPVPMAVA